MGTHKMTLEQQGMYMRLLAVQWGEGSVPNDLELISELTLTNIRVVRRLCPTLLQLKFNSSPTQVELKSNSSATLVQLKSDSSSTYWKNVRLEEERQLQVTKRLKLSVAGRKGGQKSKPPRTIKNRVDKNRIDKITKEENKDIAEVSAPAIISNEIDTNQEPEQTPYAICERIKEEINTLHGKPTVLSFSASLRPMKDLLAQGVGFNEITEVYRAVFDPSLNGDTNANWHRGKLSNATFGQHLLKNWGDLQNFLRPSVSGMTEKVDAVNQEMREKYGG